MGEEERSKSTLDFLARQYVNGILISFFFHWSGWRLGNGGQFASGILVCRAMCWYLYRGVFWCLLRKKAQAHLYRSYSVCPHQKEAWWNKLYCSFQLCSNGLQCKMNYLWHVLSRSLVVHFPATRKFWLYKFVEEIVEILLIAISSRREGGKKKENFLA